MEREIDRGEFLKASAATGALLVAGDAILPFSGTASAAELQSIPLSKPHPQTEGGNPALQLLQNRARMAC